MVVAAWACTGRKDGSEQADEAALRWGAAYFNYDLKEAARLSTPESRKWIEFVASNMTEGDVELLRSLDEEPAVELYECVQENDSTWTVGLDVSHFVEPDTIGQPGRLTEEGDFRVTVVSRNGRAYVKMEGLPQNERHSRD